MHAAEGWCNSQIDDPSTSSTPEVHKFKEAPKDEEFQDMCAGELRDAPPAGAAPAPADEPTPASGLSGKHFSVLGRSACSLSAPWLPVVAAKWVGTCPVRVGWERVPPELGGNASRQQLCLCLFSAF